MTPIQDTFFIYKTALLPLIPPVGILGTPTCGKKIQMGGKYRRRKERNTNGWKMGNMKARKIVGSSTLMEMQQIVYINRNIL